MIGGEAERWDLLPLGPVRWVVQVITRDADKSGAGAWRRAPNARQHYYGELMGQLAKWSEGDKRDPSTGLPRMAHAAAAALFLLWHDDQDSVELQSLEDDPRSWR